MQGHSGSKLVIGKPSGKAIVGVFTSSDGYVVSTSKWYKISESLHPPFSLRALTHSLFIYDCSPYIFSCLIINKN